MLSALRIATQSHRPWSSPLLQHSAAAPRLARLFHPSLPPAATLNQATRRKPPKKTKTSKAPLLEGNTQKKGVISHLFVLKPKKPNSARRKVARVKLSSGKTLQAYIQGEGHNLQEHGVVLVRGGRAQDLPGVRYKLVRGALDFGAVVNRMTARSRYGAKKPKQ
ncbi:ribosomal protein S12 [Amylocystis lapponica]|nr:ribosomal protein S12 [Amylocystis lapponica]